MSTMLDVDRVWTWDDLDGLPDELCRRVEIVDGLLVVSPQPLPLHGYIGDRLFAALTNAAPEAVHVSGLVPAFAFGRTYRVPDVCVVQKHAFLTSQAVLDPADLILAVEIESPSSITTDRITKPAQYAAAGIAHYWRVETEPLRLVAYRLVEGGYAQLGAWPAGEIAIVAEPFPVEIDVAALLPA